MSLLVSPRPPGKPLCPPVPAPQVEDPTVVRHGLRSRKKDGWKNKFLYWALTSCKWWWNLLQSIPSVERWTNGGLIHLAISKAEYRPSPYSTYCDITCWASLTDRSYYSRHLPPSTNSVAPEPDAVLALFDRCKEGIRFSDKSTVLFAHFAQWFTDGLLRTDRDALEAQNPLLKNTSNHEIDLCNLYGLTKQQTDILRSKKGGQLKSQWIWSDGDQKEEEWPKYYGNEKFEPFPEFRGLPQPLVPTRPPLGPLKPDQLKLLFAMGTERGNVTPGYAMMNVLFLREHNRIARLLEKAYPCWDDDRLFETTRNILIHVLLNIVIEDYINHIAPYHFKFRLFGGREAKKAWYRTNWVAIEFNLLYRWHSLVPDYVYFGDTAIPSGKAFYENQPLLSAGMRVALEGATCHRAGHIGLFNTPEHLMRTEKGSLAMARMARLASYNDYREAFKFPRATKFEQISSDERVVEGLETVYRRVDNVELYVGLFAEDVRRDSILAQLMGRMVGVDAFSQALTNPLLAKRVHNRKTFSDEGLDIINSTKTLNDIVSRNVANAPRVSFTYPTWRHS